LTADNGQDPTMQTDADQYVDVGISGTKEKAA
jgi:hypothetical protein